MFYLNSYTIIHKHELDVMYSCRLSCLAHSGRNKLTSSAGHRFMRTQAHTIRNDVHADENTKINNKYQVHSHTRTFDPKLSGAYPTDARVRDREYIHRHF